MEDEEDATSTEVVMRRGRGRGRGRGVRLVKSTGEMLADVDEDATRTEEPAVDPGAGFAAFDGTGGSMSIATSALRFDRRTDGIASVVAAVEDAAGSASALPSTQATRTW